MTNEVETGPNGRLRIEANPFRVRAMFAGHVLADTANALTVRRPGHDAVHYFPRHDVEMGYFGQTTSRTYDAELGEAVCHTLVMEGEIVESALCAFDEPLPGAEALRGYVRLSDDHFEVYELTAHDMAMAPRAAHVHRSVA